MGTANVGKHTVDAKLSFRPGQGGGATVIRVEFSELSAATRSLLAMMIGMSAIEVEEVGGKTVLLKIS